MAAPSPASALASSILAASVVRVGVGVGPHDPAAGCLLEGGSGDLVGQAGQLGRRGQVELLSEHRSDRQQPQRRRREELQAAEEEEGGPARRLGVGHADRVDLPLVAHPDQRARLDKAAQHGRGHEGAALRQVGEQLDRLVGKGTGHRLGQAADVGRREGLEDDPFGAGDGAQRVVGSDLLRAVGGDDEHVGALGQGPAVPAAEELEGEAVGPLAVVEEDERRALRRPQRVEEGAQGVDGAQLAVRLGAEVGDAVGRDQRPELRKGSRRRSRPLAEAALEVGGQPGALLGGGEHLGGHALEHLERPLGGPVDALAP